MEIRSHLGSGQFHFLVIFLCHFRHRSRAGIQVIETAIWLVSLVRWIIKNEYDYHIIIDESPKNLYENSSQ